MGQNESKVVPLSFYVQQIIYLFFCMLMYKTVYYIIKLVSNVYILF